MRALILFPFVALAAATPAAGLNIGDKAPALEVAATVKGKPVDLARGVHVVEFWATWCAPCRESIPHLTELAKRYRGKADVTGVSVMEGGSDTVGKVKKFVAKMGTSMDYNVAVDGPSEFMVQNWMKAANQTGIPTAFVVRDGVVLWIGHPQDGLEEVLGEAVAGTFSIAKAKVRQAEKVEREAKAREARSEHDRLMAPVDAALRANDYAAALQALDALEAQKPEMRGELEARRLEVLVAAGDPRQRALAERFVKEDYAQDWSQLMNLAVSIIEGPTPPPPGYETALRLLQGTLEVESGKGQKEVGVLFFQSRVYFKQGEKAKAIETIQKAIAMAKAEPKKYNQGMVDVVKFMQESLANYEKS